jgi:hypothetical protein
VQHRLPRRDEADGKRLPAMNCFKGCRNLEQRGFLKWREVRSIDEKSLLLTDHVGQFSRVKSPIFADDLGNS